MKKLKESDILGEGKFIYLPKLRKKHKALIEETMSQQEIIRQQGNINWNDPILNKPMDF